MATFFFTLEPVKKKLLISDYQTKTELISNSFFVFRHYQNAHGKRKLEKQQIDFIFRVRACCICLTTKFETILWWFLKEIFHTTFLSAAVEPKMSLATGKMAKECMYVLFLLLRHFVRHF